MKYWQITGFLAILILGFLLMSGCTSNGSMSPTPVAVSTATPKIVYVTVTVTPTPTPSPTPALKTVLFSDDLSHWRSEWDTVSEDSNGKIFYSGGSLYIRDNDPLDTKYTYILNKNFNDFILDVDTKLIDGTIDNWQGVNIRRQDSKNYYAFDISGDGYYGIEKAENPNLVSLAGPTRSSSINTGVGATNHIHVEANKNTLSLSVNGHLLSTITDNTFRQGTISLNVNSMPSNSFSEVVFNNLVITSI